MNGPRIVCACCGVEIQLGSPVCRQCAADIDFGVIPTPDNYCSLCAHGNKPRGGLHYNIIGGYIGKCAAGVAA